MKNNFNETHPEIKEGETFLTNCKDDNYKQIGWKSKRKGDVAYDIYGEVVKYLFPVFVNKQEYEEGMAKYRRY